MPHEIYVDWAAAYPDDAKHFVPLYARPAPLSDDQIRALGRNAFGIDIAFDGHLMQFARAIERALFEGE